MRIALALVLAVTVAAFAGLEIVNSFDAPDSGIEGLAYTSGSLYAVSKNTNTLYVLDPSSGSVEDSWPVTPTNSNGLGYAGDLLYVTDGSSTVYKYTTSGYSDGTSIILCSG
ncbi:hypothetical protein GF402_07480 [Candidatus Fermentibacteria bacterium]|nr:hypothetical protein [Candidatus Fermentibacteria bacterium]